MSHQRDEMLLISLFYFLYLSSDSEFYVLQIWPPVWVNLRLQWTMLPPKPVYICAVYLQLVWIIRCIKCSLLFLQKHTQKTEEYSYNTHELVAAAVWCWVMMTWKRCWVMMTWKRPWFLAICCTSVPILYRLDSKTLKILNYRIAKKSTNKISFHIHNNHFKQL